MKITQVRLSLKNQIAANNKIIEPAKSVEVILKKAIRNKNLVQLVSYREQCFMKVWNPEPLHHSQQLSMEGFLHT